ncbi:MAG: shikimate kinase [Eubacterium sp.]|nr:shikimate kinase [Eubacterium sp.]
MNAVKENKKNIILIGMPGAGKSTVGVILAKVLGMEFIDSDLVIQNETGCLLRELISRHGLDGFLQIEEEINCRIKPDRAVIATGGSAVFGEKAMDHFGRIGKIVYLALSEEDLAGRLGDLDERGVCHREGQDLHDIYVERSVLYEKYADITVWEEGRRFDITAVTEAICRSLTTEETE